MSTVPAAEREAIAARQVQLMTGGRHDRSGCYVLLTGFWRSEADMCPNPGAFEVCVDDYRTGFTTDGAFYPAETYSHVCAEHHEQVRRAPGFRWSSPTTR